MQFDVPMQQGNKNVSENGVPYINGHSCQKVVKGGADQKLTNGVH